MPLRKIVEKLMPAARLRHAMFTPLGAPLRSVPAPPGATDTTPPAAAPDLSEAPTRRRTTVFDLVLQAYVTSPGGD